MLRYDYSLVLIALLLFGLSGHGGQAQQPNQTPAAPVFAEAATLPISLPPTDAHIRYEGRFDFADAAGPRCAWPASAVHLKFTGSALNVKLNDTDSDEYEVVLDGRPSPVLVTKGGSHLYNIFHAPSGGSHTIDLVKRTESFFGTSQFQQFQISQGGRLLALSPRPSRRLEIIGDSISCGYGNEAKDQTERFSPQTENAFLSYGDIAARALGAEYICTAWSGRTIWPKKLAANPSNLAAWPKNTMGEVYDRTLPLDSDSQWNFRRWTPEGVVINLSTNDFNGGNPDQKTWTGGYKAFIAQVRKNYPHAAIYCATSPMLWGAPIAVAKSYLTQIVQAENAAGDKNVRLLVFETQDGKNGFGADWHPSVKTHQIMANKLAATLQSDLGWKPVSAQIGVK